MPAPFLDSGGYESSAIVYGTPPGYNEGSNWINRSKSLVRKSSARHRIEEDSEDFNGMFPLVTYGNSVPLANVNDYNEFYTSGTSAGSTSVLASSISTVNGQ